MKCCRLYLITLHTRIIFCHCWQYAVVRVLPTGRKGMSGNLFSRRRCYMPLACGQVSITYILMLKGKHSTVIRPRCDNILRWRIKLIFIYHVYAKGDCAKCNTHTGAKSYFSSFVFNLHWIRNTFFHSLVCIIKVTTVCDHRYLEKRINIVGCWCIIWTQWVKFFCWPCRERIAYLTIKRCKGQIEKLLSFEEHPGG